MKLYVVRHGEALSEEQNPERPLSEAGRRHARAVGALVGGRVSTPARVFHSGKARARETAEILAGALGAPAAVERGGLGPLDPVAPLAWEVSAWAEDTMLVGHLPQLQRLTSLLLLGTEDADLLDFAPVTAACLTRTGEGGWQIAWAVRPDLAPD